MRSRAENGAGSRENVPVYLKAITDFEEQSTGIETIINGHQWQPMNRYDIQEEKELAQGILDGTINCVPDPVLKANMYYLRSKRISMRD